MGKLKLAFAVIVIGVTALLYGDTIATRCWSAYLNITHQVPSIGQ
jgi:hypothetical protein